MPKLRTRILLFLATVVAFLGPFFAVVTIEKNKRTATAESAAVAAADAEKARYEYYQKVAAEKDALRAAMKESKAQYEAALQAQPDAIKNNTATVTKTTLQPVATQQVVTSPPKTSTRTKTS
jgi:hypothetical protein